MTKANLRKFLELYVSNFHGPRLPRFKFSGHRDSKSVIDFTITVFFDHYYIGPYADALFDIHSFLDDNLVSVNYFSRGNFVKIY